MEEFLVNQLKEYRKQENLTQKELAKKLYVTDKAISKWETKRGYPDLDTLEKISDLLNITINDLINERKPIEYFEIKSRKKIGKLPFYHFVIPNFSLLLQNKIQRKKTKKFLDIPTAKGILSIGIKAKGGLAIGLFSMGIFSLGAISFGLVSIGMLSIGLIAAGSASFGGLAIGNFSLGITAIGNLAIAMAAFGNFSIGYFALGNQSAGTHAFSAGNEVTREKFAEGLQQFHLSHSFTGVSKFFFDTLYAIQTNPFPVIISFIFSVTLFFLVIGLVIHLFYKNNQLSSF